MTVSADNGRQVVGVLGMHRAGASLTARLLHLLGIDLGPEEDFLERTVDDSEGSWEQRPLVEVNEAILGELGGTPLQPPDMDPGWERRPGVAALAERAREVVTNQFGDARRWGWKDARTSLTLPFWRGIAPEARYVVCLRDPADVAASLLRRAPRTHTFESANALWLRYSAAALEHTSDHERLLVFYEDYFTDRDRQLARLAAFVGRDGGEVSDTVTEEMEAAVDGDLRHHRTSAAELAEADTVALESRAFYLALRTAHLASEMASAADPGLLERVEPGLPDAVARFVPRLAHDAAEREAVEEAHRARDVARGAEREHRIALDRALEELEIARGEAERTGEAGAAASKAAFNPYGQAKSEGELARVERALREAQEELAHERQARMGIESSLSWKVTVPLRSAKEMLAQARSSR